jgi:hypothetical protein
MLAAEVEPGGPPRVLAEDRQVTRLGERRLPQRRDGRASMALTLATLERMAGLPAAQRTGGARCGHLGRPRRAQPGRFLERASAIVAQPVEIISGQEEARLIHLGVEIAVAAPGRTAADHRHWRRQRRDHRSRAWAPEARVFPSVGRVRLQSVFLKDDPPARDELVPDGGVHRTEAGRRRAEDRLGHFDRAIGTAASASAVVCAANRDSADADGNWPTGEGLEPRSCGGCTAICRRWTWRRAARWRGWATAARRSSCPAWRCCCARSKRSA